MIVLFVVSEDQLAIDEVEEFAANDNFLLRFEKNMTKAEIEAGVGKKGTARMDNVFDGSVLIPIFRVQRTYGLEVSREFWQNFEQRTRGLAKVKALP